MSSPPRASVSAMLDLRQSRPVVAHRASGRAPGVGLRRRRSGAGLRRLSDESPATVRRRLSGDVSPTPFLEMGIVAPATSRNRCFGDFPTLDDGRVTYVASRQWRTCGILAMVLRCLFGVGAPASFRNRESLLLKVVVWVMFPFNVFVLSSIVKKRCFSLTE